ncbi:uncharacterized protein LOC100824300 [Brachypodium distachyon]|uniref:(S)-ureidoglycine aminohydrolase cupin domain-containing protein n=1 Tax=Brachypodium distachyon TaxID=15368 RepID=I1I359_BRADI|nr:uncharacterized protein LOC100824300 [Brachypodium distachyon]KQJ96226.1 hypothetical protein BRADI_3g21670v3 [Brachypodium distachyon]|eukprot:XP_003571688.1 uncharacterized protein LOC100824300 [Brachypodium distachyon]
MASTAGAGAGARCHLLSPIPMAAGAAAGASSRRRRCVLSAASGGGGGGRMVGRRPIEDVYKVRVERGATAQARVEALRVMETWSAWRTGGRCHMPWDWQVDQLVYVVSGEVRVLPTGATTGEEYMHFVAGDLVRYPKWLEADLHFDGPYEERYRFLAYGDDN